jgi:hypothetical protein
VAAVSGGGASGREWTPRATLPRCATPPAHHRHGGSLARNRPEARRSRRSRTPRAKATPAQPRSRSRFPPFGRRKRKQRMLTETTRALSLRKPPIPRGSLCPHRPAPPLARPPPRSGSPPLRLQRPQRPLQRMRHPSRAFSRRRAFRLEEVDGLRMAAVLLLTSLQRQQQQPLSLRLELEEEEEEEMARGAKVLQTDRVQVPSRATVRRTAAAWVAPLPRVPPPSPWLRQLRRRPLKERPCPRSSRCD